jgi:replication factor A1
MIDHLRLLSRVIILISLEVVSGPVPIIGNPRPLSHPLNPSPSGSRNDFPAQRSQSSRQTHEISQSRAPPTNGQGKPPTSVSSYRNITNDSPSQSQSKRSIPIESLSQETQACNIRVRVTGKSEMRKWKKDTRSGELFTLDLTDSSGEIRATCFNSAAKKLFPMLELWKVTQLQTILQSSVKFFPNPG